MIKESECSICGKNIDNLRCEIIINFNAERKTLNETWENIPNTIISPREVLCKDCFEKFVDVVDKTFNKKD